MRCAGTSAFEQNIHECCAQRVEKNEAELKKKLSTVVKDKTKIQETIGELDKYKKEALMKTWEKVNK